MKIYAAKDIGVFVREKRKKLGITQLQLANISGNGTRFISDLENGKPTMQIGKIIDMLLVLGLDLSIDERSQLL